MLQNRFFTTLKPSITRYLVWKAMPVVLGVREGKADDKEPKLRGGGSLEKVSQRQNTHMTVFQGTARSHAVSSCGWILVLVKWAMASDKVAKTSTHITLRNIVLKVSQKKVQAYSYIWISNNLKSFLTIYLTKQFIGHTCIKNYSLLIWNVSLT